MATRLTATVFEWNSLGHHLAALAPTVASLEGMAVPATGLKVTSFSCPAYHPLAPGRCVQYVCARTHVSRSFRLGDICTGPERPLPLGW